MSRKNNMAIRRRAREFQLEREKEEQQKKLKKQEKKEQQQEKQQEQQMADSLTAATRGTWVVGRIKKPSTKLKAVRMKRNRVIRGIKVKDAESRKKIRELLAAEEAMKNMAVDASDWETDDGGMESE